MVDFSAVRGGTAYDRDGAKVGSVDEVYTSKDTGEPSFVTVHTGLFGSKTTFIPLADASVEGHDVRLPYEKSKIKGAPSIDPDAEISDAEEARLYEYYGLVSSSRGTRQSSDGDRTQSRGRRDVNRGADDSLTLSEERLRTGTRQEEIGHARLRKYVTTEHVREEVPVSREEIRITREPIVDGGSGTATISEKEVEVVLHGDRVIAEKEAVATERVRLDTETVRGTETVEADLRKEEFDVDVEDTTGGTRSRR